MSGFDSFGLSPDILHAISEMGFTEPSEVQREAIAPILDGADVIAQAKTGTGKTAAFGIPLCERIMPGEHRPEIFALVLCPTRELAIQVCGELERIGQGRGVKTLALYGGSSIGKQIDALDDGVNVIVGTPGRVLDHLRRGTLVVDDLSVLVLDEADEMLDRGFLPDMFDIMDYLPRQRQNVMVSATITDDIKRISDRHMNSPIEILLSGDELSAEGIAHFYYETNLSERFTNLTRILKYEQPELALIFCDTKRDTEDLARMLNGQGFNIGLINGDLSQVQRNIVMEDFRNGRIDYLVATDVAARGLDITGVSHVVNYNLPSTVETYVHRTGRTGRAGATGEALSLVSATEQIDLQRIVARANLTLAKRDVPSEEQAQEKVFAKRMTKVGAWVGEMSRKRMFADSLAFGKFVMEHYEGEVSDLLGVLAARCIKEELEQEGKTIDYIAIADRGEDKRRERTSRSRPARRRR